MNQKDVRCKEGNDQDLGVLEQGLPAILESCIGANPSRRNGSATNGVHDAECHRKATATRIDETDDFRKLGSSPSYMYPSQDSCRRSMYSSDMLHLVRLTWLAVSVWRTRAPSFTPETRFCSDFLSICRGGRIHAGETLHRLGHRRG